MSPFVFLTMMYTFAFSMKDEDDEDYEPRVEVRKIVTNIPKFPDISAFGPKSIGALKLLNDWIDCEEQAVQFGTRARAVFGW